jgi:transcriptional regulator with XRE-family HTH domain
METQETIGALIRSLRESKGWTQKRLAEETGISATFISNIEKGYVRKRGGVVKPSDGNINILAEVFGVPAVRLHAAMGRVEIDSDVHKQVEEQFRALSEDNKTLKLLATYEELSDRDKVIVEEMVERMSGAISKH